MTISSCCSAVQCLPPLVQTGSLSLNPTVLHYSGPYGRIFLTLARSVPLGLRDLARNMRERTFDHFLLFSCAVPPAPGPNGFMVPPSNCTPTHYVHYHHQVGIAKHSHYKEYPRKFTQNCKVFLVNITRLFDHFKGDFSQILHGGSKEPSGRQLMVMAKFDRAITPENRQL